MANSIFHAGLPVPIADHFYTVMVPYLDADGDPVDPTSPDTEISKDGGAFADCTEEITVITGSNGMGYITLTTTEMNVEGSVVIAAKSANAKTTLLPIYPVRLSRLGLCNVTGASMISAWGFQSTDIPVVLGRSDMSIVGLWVSFVTGACTGSARPIINYDLPTNDATCYPRLLVAPSVGDSFELGFPIGLGAFNGQIFQGGGFAR